MKKFAKKHLAIAVFMMALGGMTNMAHADIHDLHSQNVSADKEVKQGGAAKIELLPSQEEIFSGQQAHDVAAFVLKVSETGEHSGWRVVPIGSSVGGVMYNDQGDKVELHMPNWIWTPSKFWLHTDKTSAVITQPIVISNGQVVKAGLYHFTAQVVDFQ
ncbi:adhesin [Yersinia frederiksenii]|uniref:MyfA/PsaA family fimbrial adhesin n=1 Tax=Yersinia alsatica TaxID=2890317 RepID=UPI0005DE9BD1|nr:MyfA/PsaA family fimbrial adhesin [Yersinia alsatica]CFQ45930.1 adhesin [Yersinia frederiksenii]CNH41960.1 adhesin [Yersinia frederiksenii]CNH49130.1 adhesin [Yersinia frederiksenii]CNH67490.1 adhesin [Yersinia frederiksenii]